MPDAKTKPIEEVRIRGVKAAIWMNDTKSGKRFSVTLQRLYKEGEDWKTSSSFGRDDLLELSKVADQAHTRILDIEAEDRFNEQG